MSRLNKKLAVTAAAAAMLASLGLAVAQSNDAVDPTVTPVEQQQVDVNTNASGNQIYFFRDQGNSPETDPAAHLMLIKHDQAVPVAMNTSTTTTTTTVAQADTPAEPVTTVMPGAADTSNTESANTAMTTQSEPVLAPKADRN